MCVCIYRIEVSAKIGKIGFHLVLPIPNYSQNNFVNDLGMHKTKSNFYHWQKNKMPKAYCFVFFNNKQNTQTISLKQPQ